MQRREFLRLSAAAAVWPWINKFFPAQNINAAGLNRLAYWPPSIAGVEWRYAAGRITDSNQDFGFVVSISDINVSGARSQECLVQRQDFTGSQTFAGNRYTGALNYNDSTATYAFKLNPGPELVSWQWDDAAGVYRLNVATPELTLVDVVLTPVGDLIPEGGDGDIRVGRLAGISLVSNYHADWTTIKVKGVEKGVARVDMQGLQSMASPTSAAAPSDYDHNWFAIAAELSDGTPVWISAWKNEDIDGPFWCATVALNSGAAWSASSVTNEDAGSIVAPLSITAIDWQSVPVAAGLPEGAGLSWHLTAGTTQPNDLIDIQLTMPPGQFILGDSLTGNGWVLEGVGTQASGTVLGQPFSAVKLVVAESSVELSLTFLPIIHK